MEGDDDEKFNEALEGLVALLLCMVSHVSTEGVGEYIGRLNVLEEASVGLKTCVERIAHAMNAGIVKWAERIMGGSKEAEIAIDRNFLPLLHTVYSSGGIVNVKSEEKLEDLLKSVKGQHQQSNKETASGKINLYIHVYTHILTLKYFMIVMFLQFLKLSTLVCCCRFTFWYTCRRKGKVDCNIGREGCEQAR